MRQVPLPSVSEIWEKAGEELKKQRNHTEVSASDERVALNSKCPALAADVFKVPAEKGPWSSNLELHFIFYLKRSMSVQLTEASLLTFVSSLVVWWKRESAQMLFLHRARWMQGPWSMLKRDSHSKICLGNTGWGRCFLGCYSLLQCDLLEEIRLEQRSHETWIVKAQMTIPSKVQHFTVFVLQVNTHRPNRNVLFKVKIVHK